MVRLEIRWHGRGGQGAVTAAIIVAEAAIFEGKYAQAYPEFGAERRGAPVRAYTRLSDTYIHTRSPIMRPDVVVVLDPSLGKELYLYGLKEGGLLLINTKKSVEEVKKMVGREDIKYAVVNATDIALETLKRPIVNTAMVGALVKVMKHHGLQPSIELDSVIKAIRETFGDKLGEVNAEAAKRAYEAVVVG